MCVASIIQNTKQPYSINIIGRDIPNHVKEWIGGSGVVLEQNESLSCAAGRRRFIDWLPDAKNIVFLDDDITVTNGWLERLHEIKDANNASAVAASLISDTNGGPQSGSTYRSISGARFVVEGSVSSPGVGKIIFSPMCHGGATLYDGDALRATEYRQEFSAGYEDWDQTLQITQDQGGKICGSDVLLFHVHGAESRAPEYTAPRWRWDDLLRGAIAMHERWGVTQAARSAFVLTGTRTDDTEVDGVLLEKCATIIKEGASNGKTIDCIG